MAHDDLARAVDGSMKRQSFYLEIFLISFAALLLEISYTRVFSFKISSYYTYLILGLALLGIGAGAVFVALSARLRSLSPGRLLPVIALLGSAATGAGYFVVAGVELSSYGPPSSPGQVARLALVCGVLFSNFLAAGLMIALVFTARPEAVSRLYFADLAGAGIGCAAAIPFMIFLTPLPRSARWPWPAPPWRLFSRRGASSPTPCPIPSSIRPRPWAPGRWSAGASRAYSGAGAPSSASTCWSRRSSPGGWR
jgi:hypothetical protein